MYFVIQNNAAMASNNLFPDDPGRTRDTDLFAYDKPVSKPKLIIEKIILFIFSALGTLSAFIAISFYSVPDRDDKESFAGPHLGRDLGNLFLFITILFFFIAGCVYVSIRKKQKNIH